MKTPAEKLAAKKKPRAYPVKRRKPYIRKAFWVCAVRERRNALRLSLRDVAGAVGLSVTALHQIEFGTDPQLTTARLLAAFFGTTVEELWPKRA